MANMFSYSSHHAPIPSLHAHSCRVGSTCISSYFVVQSQENGCASAYRYKNWTLERGSNSVSWLIKGNEFQNPSEETPRTLVFPIMLHYHLPM
jgi:hypothetical protein